MFSVTSCWNYKETERLDVVIGAAIDKDKESNEFVLTAEIIMPETGQSQTKFTSILYESRGRTIFEAVRDLIIKSGRKTYWSHASIVILSKDIAETDTGPVIDWLYRDTEVRGNLYILVSKLETAKEIFQTNHRSDFIVSDHLTYALENQKSLSKFPKPELRKVVENLSNKDSVFLLAAVDMKKNDTKVQPEIYGSAVLKYDKVVGFISGDETKYTLWLRGDIKDGLLIVKDIVKPGNNITFEVFSSKTRLSPSYSNGSIKITANLSANVNIGEISQNLNFSDEAVLEQIKKESEKALKKDLERILAKSQSEYHADIFRFGNKIQIDNPNLWKKIESNWSEEFSNLEMQINVELNIRGSALTSKPVKGGK